MYRNRGSSSNVGSNDSVEKLSENEQSSSKNSGRSSFNQEIFSILLETYVQEDKPPSWMIKEFEAIYNQPSVHEISKDDDHVLEYEEGPFSFRPKKQNLSQKIDSPDRDKSTTTKSMVSGDDKISNFSGSDESLFKLKPNKPLPKLNHNPSSQSIADEDQDHNNVSTLDICLQGFIFCLKFKISNS